MSKLYRSRSDRYVTGLSGGLAETLGIDSTWIRLILVFTTFFSGGVVIVLYFLAALVIPKEPRDHGPFGPGYGYEGAGAPNWNGQAGPGWGQQPWGQEWNGKKYGCGYRKHKRNEYRQNNGHFGANNAGYPGAPGQGHTQAGDNLDDLMKDIEKKAMWKEIEDLRAKVAQYEKNQQTKGDV